MGYGDAESKLRFPHLHKPYYDGEIYLPSNLNRESLATVG